MNYIKIALRNLKKNKNHSIVNITGLSIALACSLLIFLYISHQLSYDRFHKNSNRIYRAVKVLESSSHYSAITPNPLGPSLKKNFPEIKNAVRICGGGSNKKTVSVNENHFLEDNFFLIDSSFWDVFSFPLLKGDPQTALNDPWSVVITEKAAQKYFSNKDPLGKTLIYENKYNFQVTGILKDIPDNSHFKSDIFASIKCADDLYWDGFLNDWTQSSFHNYILLKKGVNPQEFEKKLTPYLKNRLNSTSNKGYAAQTKIYLQPLTRIHLHSHYFAELEKNSDVRFVYFYSFIGIIILIIACFNFMNISTARASTRTTEVGMRKVIGANRKQLIGQFLSESIVLSLISLIIALLLAQVFLPLFSHLLGLNLDFSDLFNLPSLLGIMGITLMVGIISGSYPALFLSSFSPVQIIRGIFIKDKKGGPLRTFLVSFQFIVTITLVICTLIVFRQVHFLKNKNLGFNKDNVLAVQISNKDKNLKAQYDSFKNELLNNPSILGVTSTSNLPHRNQAAKKLPLGEAGKGKFIHLNFMRVDHDFLNTLDAKMKLGRFFSKQIPSDQNAFVINEAAVQSLEIKDPVGKKIPWVRGIKYTVIGVVKNFHFKSLHTEIEPLVLYLQTAGNIDHILVKIHQEKIPESISFIKNTFHEFSPEKPLNYFFIDQDIDRMYRTENTFMQVFGYFTFLAIFIALLGLFGLSAFNIQRKTKEISIRKVLGASMFNIITLLSKDLINLMLVANIFAWPISFFLMRKWLGQFAYRINMSFFIFLGSSGLAFVLAFITLGILALRAAKADLVDHLKYE
jgi:putative ABC transport system permease protein